MASSYEKIKAECLKTGVLYEDLDFPACADSIRPDSSSPEDWLWKRPKEISKNPKLIIDGASRFDLIQGELGDCYLISAAAVLATKRDLFNQVIRPNQSFTEGYAGIFCFNFWRFGEWVEVCVDDRLPVTVDGKLRFGQNRSTPNEFWGALLEKAYAKLVGSYEAIQRGLVRDALVDFTGGLSEIFTLRNPDKLPPDLFEITLKAFHLGSLLGAGIYNTNGATIEEKISNGLYKGHAYSITSIMELRIQGWNTKLVRLRNPWGQKEWNGAWSDGSPEWNSVPDGEKKQLGMTFEDDGEFWMSWDDFVKNFHSLDIVHLGPQAFGRLGFPQEVVQWQETSYHGSWVKGVNAGGGGIFRASKDLYFTNPHYFITLQDPDEDDVSQECTCIISIMLKQHRKRKMNPTQKTILMGFDVYQFKTDTTIPLESEQFLESSRLKKQFSTRTPLREQSDRLQLDPGTYCIIPNTLKANQEGSFLLRIYTHSKVKAKEYKDVTGPVEEAKEVIKPVGNVPADVFWRYAGENHVVDARDLRDLLNELSRLELEETTTFSVEGCRTLISMVDVHRTGTLDFEEMGELWDEILLWRKVFLKYDKDKSGCIETYELKSMFNDLGFKLSFDTISTIAIRYGGKDRQIFFEDFVLCLSKTFAMYSAFKMYRVESGEAHLNLDQWMSTTLYY